MTNEKLKLNEILKLDRYRNISLVGAGGKTTLIKRLTFTLKKTKMILISSTTSFTEPDVTKYDFIDYFYDHDYDFKEITKPGIYIIGTTKKQENLILGLSVEVIEKIAADFDYSIIECDFANGRPLKGFRDFEPVIPKTTDMTLGIIDIHSLGLLVHASNIHHLDKFIELTGSTIGAMVTIPNLKEIIDNKDALFSNAVGKKVLFINKVEKVLDQALAASLLEAIDKSKLNLIIEGSLQDETYHIVYENHYY